MGDRKKVGWMKCSYSEDPSYRQEVVVVMVMVMVSLKTEVLMMIVD